MRWSRGWWLALLVLLLMPLGLAAQASIPWKTNLINGDGFQPDLADPQSESLINDPAFAFTVPGCSGGTCPQGTRIVPTTPTDPFQKITASFTVTIPSANAGGSFHPVLDISNACSNKSFLKLWLRTNHPDQPGQFIIDARGAQKLIKGNANLDAGTYLITAVYDLADSEAYVTIARPDGTLIKTAGASINTDPSNIARAEQTAGGVKLTFGSHQADPDQLIARPSGWAFRSLNVTRVRVDAGSGLPEGPDGADLLTDEGRLAFLAATLADAANEEGGDWRLDCGPAQEVLPLPPSDEPNDAGERYCALRLEGDDVVFGTFGVAQSGDTVEQRVLTSLQDAAYALHIDIEDIDPNACDQIDTTTLAFQECAGAIPDTRVYALVHAATGSTFIITSDSAIDAFSVSFLERIGGFFRSLFGNDPDATSVMSTIPARRFDRAFFALMQDHEIAATWIDTQAALLYREFTTDLSAWTPLESSYQRGPNAQRIGSELHAGSPGDVRSWRSLTSGLRVEDVGGTPITSGGCGDGIIDLGEECEAGTQMPACSTVTGDPAHTTPIACGAPGSALECRADVSACGISTACGDTWVPVARPLPCGDSDVNEAGDDDLCRVDIDQENSCHEGFCYCGLALRNAFLGRPIDYQKLSPYLGGTPENMFTGGGSLNMAPMCHAARYVDSGNSADKTWFMQYFAWQKQNEHMGKEVMSPIYAAPVISSVAAVLSEATARGDAELAAASSDWLRTSWAVLALSTVNKPIRGYVAQVHGVPKNYAYDTRWAGPTTTIPGPRSMPGSPVWTGLHKPISYAADLTDSLGYHWWPDRVMILASGLDVDVEAAIPPDITLPAATVGLTDGERAALKDMINNGAGFDRISAMVGGAKPVVPYTFIRTTEGTMTYLGMWEEGTSSNPTGFNPNGNKGTTFAVRILNDGSTRTLYPHTESKIGKERGGAWREGTRYCARADGVTDCLDLPGGTVILIAEWSKEHGLRCIQGACGAAQPPGPGPGSCGVAASQGAYDLAVGEDENGNAQLRVTVERTVSGVDNEICDGTNDPVNSELGRVRLNTAWIPHQPGTTTQVFLREKYGSGRRYDVKIVAIADAAGWTVTGTPEGISNPNNYGAGHQCWACQYGSTYCEELNVRIDLANIPGPSPTCDPSTGGGGGGGGGGGCFIAGTPVLTPGGYTPIETLRVGDQVIAFDITAGERVMTRITEIERKDVDTLTVLSIDGLAQITTTPVHRFWTTRGWIAAGDMVVGDMVLDEVGVWREVLGIDEEYRQGTVPVWNLHVDDDAHNFYAGGVLVHNLKRSESGRQT